jgi:RNA polymerase sigma-70 factor (ECF subfamily)
MMTGRTTATTTTERTTTERTTTERTTTNPEPLPRIGRRRRAAADACLDDLYARHARTVLGLCRLLLRDRAEAEDATQQVFLSAYRSLLAGSRPRHPAAWLATITRNECWGRIQQRIRRPLHEPTVEDVPTTAPGPLEIAIRNADLAALIAAIGQLPRQQRDALLLREFSGLSYSELAEALLVSESAVESLLVRARRELRLRLQPVYGACIVPVAFVRDLLARFGADGDSGIGVAAKLASVPLAAKLATGVATVGLVGGAIVVSDHRLARPGSVETAGFGVPIPTRAPSLRPRAAPVTLGDERLRGEVQASSSEAPTSGTHHSGRDAGPPGRGDEPAVSHGEEDAPDAPASKGKAADDDPAPAAPSRGPGPAAPPAGGAAAPAAPDDAAPDPQVGAEDGGDDGDAVEPADEPSGEDAVAEEPDEGGGDRGGDGKNEKGNGDDGSEDAPED